MMQKGFDDYGKLLLRLGMGGFMLPHGISKLMKFFEGGEITFTDPLGAGPVVTLITAVVAELLCCILIIVGFKTRLSTILPAITMLVAAFIVHANDPWMKKEFPLVYFVGFLAIALLGAGKYSFDAQLKK